MIKLGNFSVKPSTTKCVLNLLLAGTFIAVTCSFFNPIARIGVDPHHDGIMFKPALDVYQGDEIFRDTFTQYGFLSTWMQAFALKLLGPGLLSLKTFTVVMYGISIAAAAIMMSRYVSTTGLFLTFCIWLLLPPFYDSHEPWSVFLVWSSVYACPFQICFVYLIWNAIGSRHRSQLFFLAGLTTVLIFHIRQPVGVFLALFQLVMLAFLSHTSHNPGQGKRDIAMFIAGGASGLLASLLYFIFTGSLSEWYLQNILIPSRLPVSLGNCGVRSSLATLFCYSTYGLWGILALTLPSMALGIWEHSRLARLTMALKVFYFSLLLSLWLLCWGFCMPKSLLNSAIFGAVPLLLLGFVIVDAFQLQKALKQQDQASAQKGTLRIILWTMGIASCTQYYPIADAWHCFWAVTPVVFVVTYAAEFFTKRYKWQAAILALAPFVYFISLQTLPKRALKITRATTALDMAPFHDMMATAKEADYWNQLFSSIQKINELQKTVSAPVVMEGDDAIYWTLSDNNSKPTRYTVNWSSRRRTQIDDLGVQFIRKNNAVVITQGCLSRIAERHLREDLKFDILSIQEDIIRPHGQIAIWAPQGIVEKIKKQQNLDIRPQH